MENLKQWKTTLLGLAGVIVSILVGFGIITPDQTADVTQNSTVIINGVFSVITGITGLVAIFAAKDKVE